MCRNHGLDISNDNHYHLHMSNQSSRTQQTGTSPQPTRLRPERVSSRQLLGERGMLIIEHQGREYRLQLTQNRKLILTA